MDLASAASVLALDIEANDHVLDLCCAPGAKLCLISNLFGKSGKGTVTGVDISEKRLSVCRKLVKKHKIPSVRLFKEDGVMFNVFAPSITCPQDCSTTQFTSTAKKKPFHAPKWLRQDPQIEKSSLLYDKVIVDAECTHDGSIAHIHKLSLTGLDNFCQKFVHLNHLESLYELQRKLLLNGFRLCKVGGLVVYSTCSFTRQQNQDIVDWLLKQCSDAQLEPIFIPGLSKESTLFLQCDPIKTKTSGLFVARIRKLKL